MVNSMQTEVKELLRVTKENERMQNEVIGKSRHPYYDSIPRPLGPELERQRVIYDTKGLIENMMRSRLMSDSFIAHTFNCTHSCP